MKNRETKKIFYKLVTQTPKEQQRNHSHYEKETYLEPIKNKIKPYKLLTEFVIQFSSISK